MRKLLHIITTIIIIITITSFILPVYADRTKLPRVVIDYKFDDARDFHEGLAAVYSKSDEAVGRGMGLR